MHTCTLTHSYMYVHTQGAPRGGGEPQHPITALFRLHAGRHRGFFGHQGRLVDCHRLSRPPPAQSTAWGPRDDE
eukprot:4548916-Prymnesium_polylepis.1